MAADEPVGLRGVIGLRADACTSCLICVRECPVWCIDLVSHQEPDGPSDDRRPRTKAVLDSFVIDFATCMFCGICVDVCPFDALEWSPVVDYPATGRAGLELGMAELARWINGS